MKVWVLRHGEAEPRANSDAERRLTAHGREQVLRSAARLLGQPLQAILASPYVRAQQTAALVHEALGFAEPVRTVPWLTSDHDAGQVIGELERLGLEQVLLVSHQPLVGTLVGLLEHGHGQQPAPMSTASLAELEGDWPLAGVMTLRGLYHPG
ncbi:phosphohistidine phosphatase SixA [Pseudomonas guariconensis]|uniref:phosphohistidine phosphatase SixA n=1 Tax=Pseudomonas TaxID=286 RepID=UPI002096E81E|nr:MULTISPECIES: phosphohistidine phosphatase SixA [Pseudomonas]MCO7637036.1 phosphohistidine phosphatase SixA [Pseudomonas sp. S 311-6]MCO7517455.1 phosphohistidine phosphatase SixA [Pseudomonas putida]MCO7567187.1 phosphohistidine phosphatase SixA [Pseudomonas mosselii]MCO7594780.1 phosphohistidine phosphatase SixA [Pseudomonas guariconensis]MCO7607939.1 phosphohistidine phosphatase SixA [Pseudomonas guariconensis]